MMPGSKKPYRPPGGPDVPPKATQESSEWTTHARRPRTRHHVKPLNVGRQAQGATADLPPNLMSDRSHFARTASVPRQNRISTTSVGFRTSRHDAKRVRYKLKFNRLGFTEIFAVDV